MIGWGWLVAWMACCGGAGAARHPADGPDVDLQWVVGGTEVRAVVDLNLVFVDELFPAAEPLPEPPAADALEALRAQLAAHLGGRMTVRAGGVDLEGVPGSLEFVAAEPALVPLFTNFGSRALAAVRMEWRFALSGDEASLTFGWSDYPPDLALQPDRALAPPITVVAQLASAGVLESVTLTRDRPLHRWRRPEGLAARFAPVPPAPATQRPWLPWGLALAAASALWAVLAWRRPSGGRRAALRGIVLASGAAAAVLAWEARRPRPLPDAREVLAAFGPLHANIYRAFGEVDERRIYEGLARSVEGRLLDALYREVYDGLVLRDEGGAVARVETVRVDEAEVVEIDRTEAGWPRAEVRAIWQVDGALFHFGHSHRRTHEYRASYELVAGAEGWRIHGHRPLARRQLAATSTDPAAGAAQQERPPR